MIFGIVLFIFILLVAFIHFVQGFFSAMLSAIFAVIAAAVAAGYHENAVAAFKPAKMSDSANAVMLCVLFAGTYLALRMFFDRALPGNVRLQSTIDKVGAAIMGLIAGTMAAGIVAIAAQTMPFGPSIFGYSRYALGPERQASFQNERGRQSIQRNITDEIKSGVYEDKDVNHLLLPADDIVLNLVAALSEGSLSGKRSFSSIHPNYLQEAFGTRIGIEVGAKRTATNFDGADQVTVDRIAVRDSLKAVDDSEFPEIRGKPVSQKAPTSPQSEIKPAKEDLKIPDPKHKILIIRALFDAAANDEKTDFFRFSPASIRLVTHPGGDTTKPATDYHPIGTMDNWANPGSAGPTFWPNHIDDPLFAHGEGGNGADLVFMVDSDDVLEGMVVETVKKVNSNPKPAASYKIKPGTFLEVKRLARVDLSDKMAESGPLPGDDKKINVMRKTRLKQPPKDVPPPG